MTPVVLRGTNFRDDVACQTPSKETPMKKPLFNLDGTHLVMLFKRPHEPGWGSHHYVSETTGEECVLRMPTRAFIDQAGLVRVHVRMYLAGTMHTEPFRNPWGGAAAIRMLPNGRGERITHKGWDWKPGGPCRFGYINRDAP